MANCPAKAAYGFMDLDTRTAKWDSRVIYWAKNFVLLQVLQHPFENEGRPLPFNWGYWLNPGEEKCCPSHIFMLCFSISGSEVCDGSPAVVPRAHRKSPEELLDAILGWAKSLNDVQIHILGPSGWCDPCLLPKFNLKKMKSLICPESTKKHFHFLYSSVQMFLPLFSFFLWRGVK